MRVCMLMFLGCLGLAGVLLCGCDGTSMGDDTELRQVQSGDSFTFQFEDTQPPEGGDTPLFGDVTWTFTTDAASGLLKNSAENSWGDFLKYDIFGLDVCGKTAEGQPGARRYHFESLMQAGDYVGLDDDGFPESMPLQGPLQLTVPAGSFTVFRYVHELPGGGSRDCWFAPALGMLVRYVENADGNVRTMQLKTCDIAE